MARNDLTSGYTPATGPGRSRRAALGAAGVLAAAVLAGGGFALGRATAPAPDSPAAAPAGLPMRSGIPVPDRHSLAGAATAAENFQVAGFRVAAGTLPAGPAATVLLAPQATDTAKAVLAAPTAPAEQLSKARTSFAPLSAAVQAYDGGHAVVLVWGVAASSSQVVPQPAGTQDWSRATVTLAWDAGQWQVTDQTYASGPWPARADQRMTSAEGDFDFRYRELTQDWSYVPEP
ncbi:hypothetical protein F0L68_40975 [Solihabitans fulvus]|uniref:Uncharacterized protein n=1 Tax=Solihabitans fulvus TaxID=1892852 RepID=A0A5B2W556_9PSEU|nr:hypothetical protein [Solihabitans fulvus]KAA2245938.1 hypothetical protein F0L68_40975 [Solihabitans fulvus]